MTALHRLLQSAGRPLAALALAIGLAGCSTNPATGDRQFTALLPTAQEAALGAQEHPKILAQFGGAYEDAALQAYVDRIGRRLAANGERPDVAYRFTVLDSDVVNAFALPGGYVYVTRGLMALAKDEAELAGVLAHEIAHITARHTAERVSRSTIANLLAVGIGVVLGSPEVNQLFGAGSQLVLSGWSREQELEADRLSVRYLAAAGYDAGATASFLETMGREGRLRAALAGRAGEGEDFSYFSTHPRTGDRVERTLAAIDATGSPVGERNADAYLSAIDGLLFGDAPEDGYVRGNSFVHPELGFAFEVPEDFRLTNGRTKVAATGPDGALILFDGARAVEEASMGRYLSRVWAPRADLRNLEEIEINGMPAATATTRASGRRGPVDARLVAIRFSPDTLYRFVFLTPPGATAALSLPLRRTTYSFRRLDAAEAARYRPRRISVVTVRPGETVEDLVARMRVDGFAEDWFRLINDLPPGTPLPPGRQVKLIVD